MQPPEGRVYTWKDGDRVRKAWLQEDLIVAAKDAAPPSSLMVAPRAAGGAVFRVEEKDRALGSPVFRSSSGSLMTLPGGVLLVFDAAWTDADIGSFFAARGIAPDRVSPLGAIPNGYVVETEPGFPSLELANALADLDGVELASPNWWTEAATK